MNGSIKLFLLICVLECGAGCATVQPWEREYLADEIMRFDPDTLESEWHYHGQEVLEGGRGGFSSAGGGCGCR
jgi:hypothetical protein